MLQQVNTKFLLKKSLQNALPSVPFYANYSQHQLSKYQQLPDDVEKSGDNVFV